MGRLSRCEVARSSLGQSPEAVSVVRVHRRSVAARGLAASAAHANRKRAPFCHAGESRRSSDNTIGDEGRSGKIGQKIGGRLREDRWQIGSRSEEDRWKIGKHRLF